MKNNKSKDFLSDNEKKYILARRKPFIVGITAISALALAGAVTSGIFIYKAIRDSSGGDTPVTPVAKTFNVTTDVTEATLVSEPTVKEGNNYPAILKIEESKKEDCSFTGVVIKSNDQVLVNNVDYSYEIDNENNLLTAVIKADALKGDIIISPIVHTKKMCKITNALSDFVDCVTDKTEIKEGERVTLYFTVKPEYRESVSLTKPEILCGNNYLTFGTDFEYEINISTYSLGVFINEGAIKDDITIYPSIYNNSIIVNNDFRANLDSQIYITRNKNYEGSISINKDVSEGKRNFSGLDVEIVYGDKLIYNQDYTYEISNDKKNINFVINKNVFNDYNVFSLTPKFEKQEDLYIEENYANNYVNSQFGYTEGFNSDLLGLESFDTLKIYDDFIGSDINIYIAKYNNVRGDNASTGTIEFYNTLENKPIDETYVKNRAFEIGMQNAANQVTIENGTAQKFNPRAGMCIGVSLPESPKNLENYGMTWGNFSEKLIEKIGYVFGTNKLLAVGGNDSTDNLMSALSDYYHTYYYLYHYASDNRFSGILDNKVRDTIYGTSEIRTLQTMLENSGRSLEGQNIIVSGYNYSSIKAIDLTSKLGGKPIIISDDDGYILDSDGITGDKVNLLYELKDNNVNLKAYVERYPTAEYKTGIPYAEKADICLNNSVNVLDDNQAKNLIANGINCCVELNREGCYSAATTIFKDAHIIFGDYRLGDFIKSKARGHYDEANRYLESIYAREELTQEMVFKNFDEVLLTASINQDKDHFNKYLEDNPSNFDTAINKYGYLDVINK